MHAKPTREHEWLQQFVGEWAFEHECVMGPGQAPVRATGTESVRSLGALWVVFEGRGEMPDGSGEMRYLSTIGFDPSKGKFVGTWVGSVMANMFVYEGVLDADGVTLPLSTDGPAMDDPTKTVTYQDVMAVHPDGRRTLTSRLRGSDGSWAEFMNATYRRTDR